MKKFEVIDQRQLLGKDFKIYGDIENPLFMAKDVATWIEHSDTSIMLRNIDENEKLVQTMFVSGQNRECWFLTEDGLYEVLLQSRKPIAKEFKKQIKQILKEIRKHGVYATNEKLEEMLKDPDTMIITLQALKEERKKVFELNEKITKDRPKVLFAEAVETSATSILIRDLSKIARQNGIEIGGLRLYEWMREKGYLIKQRGIDYNSPTQKSMELGLFEIKETVIVHSDGRNTISKTPRVTAKGQIYFINKLLESQLMEEEDNE